VHFLLHSIDTLFLAHQENAKRLEQKISNFDTINSNSNGKAVPLEAWSGPEVSRKLRFPDFMTTAQDGGKIVSLKHRTPQKYNNYNDSPINS
jgi:hypothetical protein